MAEVKNVAVLSHTKEIFEKWYKEVKIINQEKIDNVKYICILNLEDARGRQYTNIIRLTGWWRMENADEVEEYLNRHIVR